VLAAVQLNQMAAQYVHETDQYLRYRFRALSAHHASPFSVPTTGGLEEDRGETDNETSPHTRGHGAHPAFTLPAHRLRRSAGSAAIHPIIQPWAPNQAGQKESTMAASERGTLPH
jgi:hypothetical protein